MFRLIWNLTVMILNIGNFWLFMMLTLGDDVNDLLRRNELVDSYKLSYNYYVAQIFDSALVLMNMFMII